MHSSTLRRLCSIALLSSVLVGGLPTMAIASLPTSQIQLAQRSPRQPSTSRLPRSIANKVRLELARQLNLNPRSLIVVNASRETWPDSCLGLGGANEVCLMLMVQGWRIELTNGQQNWVVRTDLFADVIRPESLNPNQLTPQAANRLLRAVARDAKVPFSTLKIIEAQQQIWNGCMGIYVPNQMCTMIAMPGYRVIVMGQRQSWIYHVNQDASIAVQNSTASGAGSLIYPAFYPAEAEAPTLPQNIVFKMSVSGGLAGFTTDTVLTADGTIYRQTTGGRSPNANQRTVLKRISAQEVQRFRRLLEQQRFPNVNGISYLTEAALADYPITSIQAMNSSVAYVDLEVQRLPQSLRAVINAWSRLIQ